MPYIDFDKATHAGTNGTLIGGAEGAAQLHASLANPLTGEDLFCRHYLKPNGLAIGQFYFLNDAAFIGIPATKKVSLRAWVRRSGGINLSVGLIAKAGNSDGSTCTDRISGYWFAHGGINHGDDDNTLGFSSYGGTPNLPGYIINGTGGGGADEGEANFQGFNNNLWHKIRMDILPIGDANDEVRLYTGTGVTGSEIWTLEHTLFVASTDAHWVPHNHGSSNRYGFFVGHHRNPEAATGNYIDRFQIFVEDV